MTSAGRSALDRLFRPKSVAVIGASADPSKIAGRPLRFLRLHGFAGDIWPINPRYDQIDGVPCFADVDALPAAPDVAVVLVGPDRAEPHIRALAHRGAGAAIVLAGGYAEIGPDGAARQDRLRDAAGDMRVLGPNTIGLVNLVDAITLSASGALDVPDPWAGGIAVVSQSGGILGSILSRAAYRGVGLSRLAATGNEADLEVCDLVDYLVDDPATSVIALYLETLRRPDRFREVAASAAARGKPIVVYKVGRSEAGARSAASHTGALAGEDRLYDALFEQTGVFRVSTYADLIDVPMALSAGKTPAGRRLAILTSTGGAGGLVADVCGVAGFGTPSPGAATVARLSALLRHEGFAADRNPIDLTLAGLSPEVIGGAIAALMESPDFDAVVVIVGSSGVGRPDLVATPVIESVATATKPLLVYTSPSAPEIVRRLNGAGVPAFDTPEGCAAALDAAFRAGRMPRERVVRAPAPPALPADVENWTGPLNEAESKRLFAAFGIPVVREAAVPDAETAARRAREFGPEVVLKILAREVSHKSELGGVRVGVPVEDVAGVCQDMEDGIPDGLRDGLEGFLVQERIVGGVEMILGFVRDPQLGPAILLGAGGVAAELYDDTAVRLLPLDTGDVPAMVDKLRIGAMLRGFRGRPVADVKALATAVAAFAAMCAAYGDRLLEAEINPLFVLPEGEGVLAADGVVVLRDREEPAPPGDQTC